MPSGHVSPLSDYASLIRPTRARTFSRSSGEDHRHERPSPPDQVRGQAPTLPHEGVEEGTEGRRTEIGDSVRAPAPLVGEGEKNGNLLASRCILRKETALVHMISARDMSRKERPRYEPEA